MLVAHGAPPPSYEEATAVDGFRRVEPKRFVISTCHHYRNDSASRRAGPGAMEIIEMRAQQGRPGAEARLTLCSIEMFVLLAALWELVRH